MSDLEAPLQAALRLAQEQDPSIDVKAGSVLVRAGAEILAADPSAAASDVARQLLVRYPGTDASWAAQVARAVLATARAAAPEA